MIFWCGIIAILLITGIVLFAVSPRCSEMSRLLACVFVFAAFLIGVAVGSSYAEYIEFEKEVEIMRETVEFIDQVQSPEKLFYVADIATLNKDIVKWQACYEIYGAFCTVPPRVLDIVPIGVMY